MLSTVANQPAMSSEMEQLQDQITSPTRGSITSVQAVFVPADDYTDPAPATVFAHLDATLTLDRAIFARALFPAVDPLNSTSRILDPLIFVAAHYTVAPYVNTGS